MTRVWLCGIAPAEKSVSNGSGGQVAWCASRLGGQKLRACIGKDFDRAQLRNACDLWPGKNGRKDKVPHTKFGVELLKRISESGGPGEHQLVALIGVDYWGRVLKSASLSQRQFFSFYNDPLNSDKPVGSYNIVQVALPERPKAILQLIYLPHTNHWPKPKNSENVEDYRIRVASAVEEKKGFFLNAEGFLASIEDITLAFDNPLDVNLSEKWAHAR